MAAKVSCRLTKDQIQLNDFSCKRDTQSYFAGCCESLDRCDRVFADRTLSLWASVSRRSGHSLVPESRLSSVRGLSGCRLLDLPRAQLALNVGVNAPPCRRLSAQH